MARFRPTLDDEEFDPLDEMEDEGDEMEDEGEDTPEADEVPESDAEIEDLAVDEGIESFADSSEGMEDAELPVDEDEDEEVEVTTEDEQLAQFEVEIGDADIPENMGETELPVESESKSPAREGIAVSAPISSGGAMSLSTVDPSPSLQSDGSIDRAYNRNQSTRRGALNEGPGIG